MMGFKKEVLFEQVLMKAVLSISAEFCRKLVSRSSRTHGGLMGEGMGSEYYLFSYSMSAILESFVGHLNN